MDPVTLIVTALAAGAVFGLKDTASAAVKDAYAGLKALVKRRFVGRPKSFRRPQHLRQGRWLGNAWLKMSRWAATMSRPAPLPDWALDGGHGVNPAF